MTRCVQVFRRGNRYLRIPDTEIEDWDEVREGSDGEPQFVETVSGFEPYTHAFRLPEGIFYLVALSG